MSYGEAHANLDAVGVLAAKAMETAIVNGIVFRLEPPFIPRLRMLRTDCFAHIELLCLSSYTV
jgi:hypothetical protein